MESRLHHHSLPLHYHFSLTSHVQLYGLGKRGFLWSSDWGKKDLCSADKWVSPFYVSKLRTYGYTISSLRVGLAKTVMRKYTPNWPGKDFRIRYSDCSCLHVCVTLPGKQPRPSAGCGKGNVKWILEEGVEECRKISSLRSKYMQTHR